jgi:rubredoxin
MPWKCPACETQLRLDGPRPEANRVYRCSVCRLELVLDDEAGRLTVAPLPPPVDNEPGQPQQRG